MTAYAAPVSDPTNITGRRIGAWSIDLIIYLIAMFALGAAFGRAEIKQYEGVTKGTAESFCDGYRETQDGVCFVTESNGEANAIVVENAERSVVLWGIHFLGYVLVQGLAGGSLGKLAVGLRVVDDQGRQAGLGRSFLRTVMWLVDAFTCGLPILGGILMVSTRGHRRLGDMAAGTYVVAKEQMGRPPMQAIAQSGFGTPGAWGSAGASASASGWGAPPVPSGWGPGAQGSAPSAVAPVAETAGGEGPQWDEARNAYIQYDRDRSAWVQWHDGTQEWRPIDQ